MQKDSYAMDGPQINVCNGGTLPDGTHNFTFTAANNATCEVQWIAPVPPGATNIPIANGSSRPVNVQGWHRGSSYAYRSTCGCDQTTNPKIIMQ